MFKYIQKMQAIRTKYIDTYTIYAIIIYKES